MLRSNEILPGSRVRVVLFSNDAGGRSSFVVSKYNVPSRPSRFSVPPGLSFVNILLLVSGVP